MAGEKGTGSRCFRPLQRAKQDIFFLIKLIMGGRWRERKYIYNKKINRIKIKIRTKETWDGTSPLSSPSRISVKVLVVSRGNLCCRILPVLFSSSLIVFRPLACWGTGIGLIPRTNIPHDSSLSLCGHTHKHAMSSLFETYLCLSPFLPPSPVIHTKCANYATLSRRGRTAISKVPT